MNKLMNTQFLPMINGVHFQCEVEIVQLDQGQLSFYQMTEMNMLHH